MYINLRLICIYFYMKFYQNLRYNQVYKNKEFFLLFVDKVGCNFFVLNNFDLLKKYMLLNINFNIYVV